MVEKRSYRKSQGRFREAPTTAGFDVFILDLRLSSRVGFGTMSCSSSFLEKRLLPILCVCSLISKSDEKESFGVCTLDSEGVSAAESFSGVFDRDVFELESVLYISLYRICRLLRSSLCSYMRSFCFCLSCIRCLLAEAEPSFRSLSASSMSAGSIDVTSNDSAVMARLWCRTKR